MKPIKIFSTIQDSALESTFFSSGKLIADSFGVQYNNYNCKVYNFLTTEGKVFITFSDSDDYIVDEMSNYPLGRSHSGLIEEYEVFYSNDSTISSFNDAINVGTAIADKLTDESDKIFIVILKDLKTFQSTKTILPSIFTNSSYVANVPDVVIGDASSGNAILPDIWNDDFNGDGIVI